MKANWGTYKPNSTLFTTSPVPFRRAWFELATAQNSPERSTSETDEPNTRLTKEGSLNHAGLPPMIQSILLVRAYRVL